MGLGGTSQVTRGRGTEFHHWTCIYGAPQRYIKRLLPCSRFREDFEECFWALMLLPGSGRESVV